MGDENRGIIFAQFVIKQFPKVRNVLDVAGGKGQVARKLANKGLNVTIVDLHPRLEGSRHPKITYKKSWFDDCFEFSNYDIVIGMHPDEATGEIIRYASIHKITYAIVPCCVKGRDAVGVVNKETKWLEHLASLAKKLGLNAIDRKLKMSGRNVVLSSK